MSRMATAALLVAQVAVLCAGCANANAPRHDYHPYRILYEGSQKPLESVAVLMVLNYPAGLRDEGASGRSAYTTINGQAVPFSTSAIAPPRYPAFLLPSGETHFPRYKGECHILPGQYTLAVHIYHYLATETKGHTVSTAYGDLSLSTEANLCAGRVYEVHYTVFGNPNLRGSWRLEVVDIGSVREFAANYGPRLASPGHWAELRQKTAGGAPGG